MPHFTKPAEGSWTEHYRAGHRPGVVRGLDLTGALRAGAQGHLSAKTWLNVGRIEQLPRKGSYFTREIEAVARTSVVIVRGTDDEIRAFYNVCRHRGNKLVWNDFPKEETSGTCRQFSCKYHGWRYGLDGGLTFVQQEPEFFDLDKDAYGLVPVRCEVWQGFMFINLDADDTTPVERTIWV